MKTYEYRHLIGFEETNFLGNVYYVNHIRWQGRCREMFLREHAPTILAELSHDLRLATVRCSCHYLEELTAFDEIRICMSIASLTQNRITMTFTYWRSANGNERLVAQGEQQVACLRWTGERLVPTPVPEQLVAALQLYGSK